MKTTTLLLACVTLTVALPPPHPDVVQVRLEEELLPHHLRKPALHNPHLREVLPLSSLLHPGEKLVYNREAHDVSRKEIYSILTHAGLISRTDPHRSQQLRHQPAVIRGHDPDIIPYLHSQDLLQHLYAHDVCRNEIYDILTHAGLQNYPHQSQQLRHHPAVIRRHDPDITPYLHRPDLL